MTLGVAEEAAIASADNNRVCSDGRSRKDECSGSEGVGIGSKSFSKTGSLCYGHRSGKELLRVWGIWAYGPLLQESGYERKSGEQ